MRGMRFKRLTINQNQYEQPRKKLRGFLFNKKIFKKAYAKSVSATSKKTSVQKQQHIFIHQRLSLGNWFTLPIGVVCIDFIDAPISNRTAKMYKIFRPRYAQLCSD